LQILRGLKGNETWIFEKKFALPFANVPIRRQLNPSSLAAGWLSALSIRREVPLALRPRVSTS
jgi:hypothetical protein